MKQPTENTNFKANTLKNPEQETMEPGTMKLTGINMFKGYLNLLQASQVQACIQIS